MEIINLCPTQKMCGVECRNDHNEYDKCISYFIKFDKINIRLKKPSIDDIKNKIIECKKICNKITDIFTVNKKDLTDFIIKNFRYVEIPIQYEYKTVDIPPYILGAWLGDGHSACTALTNIDKPIIEAWKSYAKSLGLHIREDGHKDRITDIKSHEMEQVIVYHITSGKNMNNPFRKSLQFLNLLNNKHIPDIYLYNSVEVRCSLLAGLLDTDGSLSNGQYEITQKNEKLSYNIVTLCKSLGFYTKIVEKWNSCKNSLNLNHIDKYYRISISINQFSPIIPVLCERKKFDHEHNKFWFNPKINLQGDIILNNEGNTIWTDELSLILYSVVEIFKQKEPTQIIPWIRLHEFDERLKDIKVDARRVKYEKNLKINEHLYKNKILQLNFNVIENEWMIQYEKVKQSFIKGEKIVNHSWYQSQKHYETLYKSKKKLLLELENLKPRSHRDTLKEDLLFIKSEIIKNKKFENVIILKNEKLIIPYNTIYNNIGNTINQLTFELKKDKIIWNGMTKDEIIHCFDDILDEFHLNLADNRTDMIIQFDLENNILRNFNSCLDAATYMVNNNLIKSIENGKRKISSSCKSGTIQYNYKWAKWIEYNRNCA